MAIARQGSHIQAFTTPTKIDAHAPFPLAFRSTSPTQEQHIRTEIQTVFGPDAPKAFRLLDCENPALNPSAVNINTDGSRDVGVFQINNRWQGVSNETFLRDYTINVRMAHSIYARSGHSFRLWSCGQRLHI